MISPTHEAEAAVLGTVALAPDTLPKFMDLGLRAGHFVWPTAGHAFRDCLVAYDQGKPVDEITVPALIGFTGGVPNLANWREYGRMVMDEARWREIRAAGEKFMKASDQHDELLLEEAERMLQIDYEGAGAFTKERLAELMYDRMEKGPDTTGYLYPLFEKLRLRRRTVHLWGGHTSHGKTLWVDQCAREFAPQGARIVLYLNEMTAEERMCRWATTVTGIPFERIEDNDLTDVEKAEVVRAFKLIPFEIVECHGWREEAICRDIRIRKPDVAIVDILHEIPYREERDLADIMRSFTTTAKVADVAILATVHLNRGRQEGAARPRPVMGDIKGASAFEQGADLVGMVWREDNKITGRPTLEGMIFTLKYRQGKLSTVDVRLEAQRAEFSLL